MPSHSNVRSTIQRLGRDLNADLIAFDDLHRSRAGLLDYWGLITAITGDFAINGKQWARLPNKCRSVTVLHARRVDLGFRKHAKGVDQNVPLAAPDLLASVVAALRRASGPVFTDWLSMLANDGWSSRPSSCRVRQYSDHE